MTLCPKCGGRLAREVDQYGERTKCWMGCWDDSGLAGAPPIYKKTGKGRGMHEGPYLPKQSSNYLPWREREKAAWQQEIGD